MGALKCDVFPDRLDDVESYTIQITQGDRGSRAEPAMVLNRSKELCPAALARLIGKILEGIKPPKEVKP